MENNFEFVKSSQLANRVFKTVEDVEMAVRKAWLDYIGNPERIYSIANRESAILPAESNSTSAI